MQGGWEETHDVKKKHKGFKSEKCIGKGAHIGGKKGKLFMPEYLSFWKKSLID